MQAPDPTAFTIFGIDIMWYGILIGIAFIAAIFLTYRRAPVFGIKSEHILDFAIFLIPASIIGARLYYVLFNWSDYSDDLISVLDLRGGGLAIHGGLIAGLITGALVCRYHHINFWDLADLTFPQVALAQAIGRWGNFFNSEAHGGPTDLPWGIIVDGEKVHPTFLYESIWCLLIFLLLLGIGKGRRFRGQLFLLYCILYSAERFFVESLRTDSLMIGPFKQAQVLSAVVFAAAMILYAVRSRKNRLNALPKAETAGSGSAENDDDTEDSAAAAGKDDDTEDSAAAAGKDDDTEDSAAAAGKDGSDESE